MWEVETKRYCYGGVCLHQGPSVGGWACVFALADLQCWVGWPGWLCGLEMVMLDGIAGVLGWRGKGQVCELGGMWSGW